MRMPPCKGCPMRTPACHDRCGKYRAWREEKDRENRNTREMVDLCCIHRGDFDAEFWHPGASKVYRKK